MVFVLYDKIDLCSSSYLQGLGEQAKTAKTLSVKYGLPVFTIITTVNCLLEL